MSKLLFVAAAFFFITVSNGQNREQDSLQALLKSSKPDTMRVKVLNELCWTNRLVDREQAFNYGNEALRLSEKIGYKKGIAQSYNDMGILYTDESNFVKSIEYYGKSLEIRKQLGDSMGMGACYIKMGISQQQSGHYKEAVDEYLKCLPIYEKLNFEIGLGNLLNNIAIVEFNMGNDATSLKYQSRSIAIREKLGDSRGVAGSYTNVGNIYHRQNLDDSALFYYKKATKVLEEKNVEIDLPILYNNLCAVYSKRLDYKQAKVYGHKALALRRKFGDKKGISSSLCNLADIAVNEKEFDAAKGYLDEGLALSLETGALPERQQAYRILAYYHEKTGNPQLGLDFFRKYVDLKDSLVNEANFKALEELRTRYETDKKENDNILLAQQNKLQALTLKEKNLLIYSLVGSLVFLVLLGLLAYNRYKIKQEKIQNGLMLEQEKTRTRSIIIGQEDERKRIAAELHDGIGQTLAAVRMNMEVLNMNEPDKKPLYETVLKMIDDSCREIRSISHNMMPAILVKSGLVAAVNEFAQNINAAGKLKVIVDAENEDRLGSVAEINLFRVVQELVQNTVKYAHAKEVHIQLTNENGNLALMVEDDGKGFDKNILTTSAGNGWSNIFSRVNLLGGTVEVDSSPGRGTVVFIDVPAEALKMAA